MSKLRFTSKARADLIDIWLHIESQTSDTVADRIERHCRVLAEHPLLGPARPEIAADARVLVMERWLALYRVVESDVQIVRVIDGARDLTAVAWAPD